MNIPFEKKSGCGNDFILIDNTKNQYELKPDQIKKLCDRHFGIGADGLILVEKPDGNWFMNYYNADGTPAETCGNGLRCTADFIVKHGFESGAFDIRTRAGTSHITPEEDGYTVSLNQPNINPSGFSTFEVPVIGKVLEDGGTMSLISMGNPHLVIANSKKDLDTLAEQYAGSELFPNGININKVDVISPEYINVQTYERGVGKTLACGSGTCASVYALSQTGETHHKVTAKLPGGEVSVSVLDNRVLLSGPVSCCFKGEVEI